MSPFTFSVHPDAVPERSARVFPDHVRSLLADCKGRRHVRFGELRRTSTGKLRKTGLRRVTP